MRTITLTLVIAVLTAALGGTVWAGTINGTAKSDVLRGGTRADKLFGRAGNDKLYGLAGNDVLNGGTGNDLLVGGPGADTLECGPGHDQAMADARDKVAKDCEVVKGLPKPPAISIADASIAEGNSGTTTLTMAATLSAPSAKIVSVHFATIDGTATAATGDYVTASGTLTFNPGQTAGTVDVTVNGDTAIEPDETLTVNLSSPVNATDRGWLGDRHVSRTRTRRCRRPRLYKDSCLRVTSSTSRSRRRGRSATSASTTCGRTAARRVL